MHEAKTNLIEEHCLGCVFYPPNLPQSAYTPADWQELQAMDCSLEHTPGSAGCLASRKTSCSLLDLGRPG